MNPIGISKEGVTAIRSKPLTFRNGQIVQGKIMKLFPNQMAEIQIGPQRLIAKLDAALTLHERYHFQVQHKDGLIYLKVIANRKNQQKMDATNLLKQLGIKSAKVNVQLVQYLIENYIPFEKSELKKAISLLEKEQRKDLGQQVLAKMIKENLPLNASVFQSLLTKEKSHLSEMMSHFLQLLQKSGGNTELSRQIGNLIEYPLTEKGFVVKRIIADLKSDKLPLYRLFQLTGSVPDSVDHLQWRKEWNKIANAMKGLDTRAINQKLKQIELPFQLKEQELLQPLRHYQKDSIETFTDIILRWSDKITDAIHRNSGLAQKDFLALTQQVNQHPISYGRNLKNTAQGLQQLLSLGELVWNKEMNRSITELIVQLKEHDTFVQASPKTRWMLLTNQILNLLSYESDLVHRQQLNESIKPLLIELIQNSQGQVKEHAIQLLQFIQGLQINSIQEFNHMIHLNIQIPGEKFGLPKDMKMEFESRKTKDGKINADYCRVLFFLDLTHIKETVIEMNVQKRSISITVYNDTPILSALSAKFQTKLKNGLESVHYNLSRISFKPLNTRVEQSNRTCSQWQDRQSSSGVDVRI